MVVFDDKQWVDPACVAAIQVLDTTVPGVRLILKTGVTLDCQTDTWDEAYAKADSFATMINRFLSMEYEGR